MEDNKHEFTFMMGDPTKGGRDMTEEERKGYLPPKSGEVPAGLERCPDCSRYRGYCVDPKTELVVFVICPCQHAFCTRCGKKLELQPISNDYNEEDGNIWHVPWFGGACSEYGRLGTNNSSGDYCHACGKFKCPKKCACYVGEKLHRHLE